MNAADDKLSNPTRLKGKSNALNTTCNSVSENNDIDSRSNLNGTMSQSNDCDDQSPPKKVNNRTNVFSNGVCGNDKPSTSKSLYDSPGCSRSETSQTEQPSNKETEEHSSSTSKIRKCHSENENHFKSNSVQNQCHNKSGLDANYEEHSSSEDEECCIYTYKGDSNQMADLPNSFFRRLDFMPQRQNRNSGNSSPDMDYLEMDFDPGPSNDKDSSSSSDCGEEMRDDGIFPDNFQNHNPVGDDVVEIEVELSVNLASASSPLEQCSQDNIESSQPKSLDLPPRLSTPPLKPPEISETKNESSHSFCTCGSNTISTSIDENFNDGEIGTMIMKEREVEEKSINQSSMSGSGATAVANALIFLNVPYSTEVVEQSVATRLCDEKAPLPDYLISRSRAGTTHEDVIQGLHTASNDLVYARFFPLYPQRSVALTSWLSHWIRKGVVPILTLNAQSTTDSTVDAWQHRTVYGVSARGIHLTNPLETVSEAWLRPQVSSPSVLLVRRSDVVSRYSPSTSLHSLIDPTLPDWRRFNVLGQVAHAVRESLRNLNTSSHVKIPASCSSGVTLVALKNSPAYEELRCAPELLVDFFALR